MNDKTHELVGRVLATLAQRSSGQIVIPFDELVSAKTGIHVDFDEAVGAVTLTVIPDYVQIGQEDPAPEEEFDETFARALKWDDIAQPSGGSYGPGLYESPSEPQWTSLPAIDGTLTFDAPFKPGESFNVRWDPLKRTVQVTS